MLLTPFIINSMSTEFDTQIEKGLEEINNLQKNIERLQQEKNKKRQEEEFKQAEVEPNIKFMSDWLEKYGEAYDEAERKRARQAKKLQRMSDIDRKYSQIDHIHGKLRSSSPKPLSSEEKEIYDNQDAIREEYNEYHPTLSRSAIIEKKRKAEREAREAEAKETVEEKEIKLYIKTPIGGCFMKKYIEATHNLFVIQEKRIAELEQKVEMLY